MKSLNKIICPVCGTEYLSSEVFNPSAFIGSANPVKDKDGKILTFIGELPDLSSTYNCDNCHTDLFIRATIKYEACISENNFEEEYVSEIYRPIELVEDD